MGFFNTSNQLFKNPFKRDEMPKMKVTPEPVPREKKNAVPVTSFQRQLTADLGNRFEKHGIAEAKDITGKDLYPAVLTENHDALMKSPQFRGLRLNKERFTYFLGINFFCLGVIHHHWEEELGKKTDRFTASDTARMNQAVKKKKDNYALAFEYLGVEPKSEYGQAIAKQLNDLSDRANALAAGKVSSDPAYSRVYSQILFQAGYAAYAAAKKEKAEG